MVTITKSKSGKPITCFITHLLICFILLIFSIYSFIYYYFTSVIFCFYSTVSEGMKSLLTPVITYK